MATKKIQIVNHNQDKNATYGLITVPEPKNFTRNGAYISQYKYNMSDLDAGIESAKKFFSGDKNNGGFAAQLISCVEIDWGEAIEGWTVSGNENWDDGNHEFPEKIKTSADLLQYIFMLRWKLEHINVNPAEYTLTLNPSSLEIQYKLTGTITASASQQNTTATVQSYAWSLADEDKFAISDNTSATPTISHIAELISTWGLPIPTLTPQKSKLENATDNCRIQCTPNEPNEIAPANSKSTLTCTATWTDGHIETKTVDVKSNGYDHSVKPTIVSYAWSIVSGQNYATLSNETNQECTFIANNTTTNEQQVKVKCVVSWSNNGQIKTKEKEITITVPAVQQEYYWYAGQTQPTSLTSDPTVDDENFTNNKWHTLGTATTIGKTIMGGTSGLDWYVAVPTAVGLKPTASDLSTPNPTWDNIGTITVNNVSYSVWRTNSKNARSSVYMAIIG